MRRWLARHGQEVVGFDVAVPENHPEFGDVLGGEWPIAHSALLAYLPEVERLFAVPAGGYDLPDLIRREDGRPPFLDAGEIAALLTAPDRSTWTGRRDHAILLVALQTGLRASELINLRCRDVVLGAGAHIRCNGKGQEGAVHAATPRYRQGAGNVAQGAARAEGMSRSSPRCAATG